jgi:hypothetical protein
MKSARDIVNAQKNGSHHGWRTPRRMVLITAGVRRHRNRRNSPVRLKRIEMIW